MMNEITIYKHVSFGQIRTTIDENGVVWICAKDVCKILGYANPTESIRRYVPEKGREKFSTLTRGGYQLMLYIDESGLYALILASRLAKAKEFQHWVTSDVLPSIRATGTYTVPSARGQGILTPTYLRQLADRMESLEDTIVEEREERKRLEFAHAEEIAQVKQEAREAEELVSGLRATGDCILVRELDTILRQHGVKLGERGLFSELVADGFFLYKKLDHRRDSKPCYLPTHKSKQLGLFEVTERTIHTNSGEKLSITSRVTGKGQMYFITYFTTKYNINKRKEGQL